MSEPLDELYLKWLYSQVANPRARRRTHWKLLREMYTTEFVWLIPNDDNRVEDGRDLRHEFLTEAHICEVNDDWMALGCSFLEMAIGLSRRLSFETENSESWWFWTLMENLDLKECTDQSDIPEQVIASRLNAVIWRTYDANGRGGLFPLANSMRDQRTVEIWYQLQTYLLECGYV